VLPFERFHAWRACHRLAVAVYRATAFFPREERYGLSAQARSAAFSAAANLAEGSAKRGKREFRRYLDISLGSLSELAYCLQLAKDTEMVGPETWAALDAMREEAGKLTWLLYRSLR
jgi:four helix bundle protein